MNNIKNEFKNTKLIELKSVYAGYDNKTILSNINLCINRTDFLGIIGPNGGGKTTLLKLIIGFIKPYKGELIYYNDFKTNKIGYLPQFHINDKYFPITVFDIVISGVSGILNKKNKSYYENKCNELLKQNGIQNIKDKTLNQLSGGQIQRVYLSRALISEPELLILDEPSSFIDKSFEKNLYDILKDLNDSGITIILVSHDLGIISSNVKQIACVNKTLHYHEEEKITEKMLDEIYSCPVDILAHGDLPHRVLKHHN